MYRWLQNLGKALAIPLAAAGFGCSTAGYKDHDINQEILRELRTSSTMELAAELGTADNELAKAIEDASYQLPQKNTLSLSDYEGFREGVGSARLQKPRKPYSGFISASSVPFYQARILGVTVVNSPSFQAEAGIQFDDLMIGGIDLSGSQAGIWTSHNLETDQNTETDLYATVPLIDTKDFSLSASYFYFFFPELERTIGLKPLHEVDLSLSLKNVPLNPTITAGKIFGPVVEEGYFFSVGLGETLYSDDNATLSASGFIVNNQGYVFDDHGFTHAVIGLNLQLKDPETFGDDWSFNMEANYQIGLGEDREDEFWLRIGITKTF